MLEKTPVLVVTDIGRDVDDLAAFAYLKGSGKFELAGVVTSGSVPGIRARVVRAVLDSLELGQVPVGFGTSNKEYDKQFKEAEKRQLEKGLAGTIYEKALKSRLKLKTSLQVILETVESFGSKLVVIVLGPPTDLALAVNAEYNKMLGVSAIFATGQALFENNRIIPDRAAYNFRCDYPASQTIFELQVNVPFTFLSKYAAYAVPLNRGDFEQIKLIGHPAGTYLGLQAERNLEYYVNIDPETFKRVFKVPSNQDANSALLNLWDMSNPYDVLTVMSVCRPDLFQHSEIGRHTAIGLSNEQNGVPNSTVVKKELMRGIMDGLK